MTTTLSLSKGCFVKTPKTTIKNRKRKNDFESSSMTQRWESYKEMTIKIDEKMKLIQSEVHKRLFAELVAHCLTVTKNWSPNSLHYSLPAVALVTGVNLPDHKEIFLSMLEILRNNVSSHIATLNSRDCSTIKSMIRKMVSQLMKLEDVGDEEECINLKTTQCTYPVLASWYENSCSALKLLKSPSKQQNSSPKKQKLSVGGVQPVVVILEDLESYAPNVLQDFILISSDYQHKIPLVIIFGVSTCVSAVHKLLPQSVSSKLAIEKLHVPLSTHYLNVVVEKLVMSNDIEFKLGGKTYQLLEEMFVYHDFCVKNFMKGLKFCMFEHFTNNEQSVLCCKMENLQARINSLNKEELLSYRKLPSFQRYVEEQPTDEQEELLNEKNTKQLLINLLVDTISYHETFYPLVHCLHSLTHDLPNSPFGKYIREVYSNCLKSNFLQSEEFETAMKLIQMLAKEELIEKLKQCSFVAHQYQQRTLIAFAETLEDYMEQLEHVSTSIRQADPLQHDKIQQANKLHLLKKTIMETRKKSSPFDELRVKIKDYICGVFREEMKHPYDQPLYEVLYFDSVPAVKKKLLGTPRAIVQTALENSKFYLNCKCCQSSDVIDPSSPDICIAYRLHLESGRLVNLYDWLQSFSTVVTADDSPKKVNGGSQNQIDPVIQARFAQAVSELQFLGFIKPSGRKVDHVARLTWNQ